MIGRTLSQYKIIEKLGEGGMGEVYKAKQLSLDRFVALKVLPSDLSSNAEFVKRFQREARAIARLNHPNIVQIYDISNEQDLHFFSMELLEGETLEALLNKRIRLDVDEAVKIISEAAQGIEHAHKNGIIHRDIKPSNIIIDKRGTAKVMDFGVARSAENCTKLTQSGTLLGTIAYMSPEQCRSEEPDQQSDIFSLGVVLYEMLTGAIPFTADSAPGVIHKICSEEPAHVRNLNPEVPPGLAVVLVRAMAKDKKNRYTNIAEFLSDIDSCRELEIVKHKHTTPIGMVAVEETGRPLIAEKTPFVGRESERRQLLMLIEDVSAKKMGSFVMIGGEPGVGKTRLTEELAIEARRYGFLCLTGRCYDMEETPPYIPFVEVIENTARIAKSDVLLEILGDSAPEVAKLVPGLRRTFRDIPPAAVFEDAPEQERRYLFNALIDFIARSAKVQPLLLVLEDLHCADESTILLLQYIVNHISGLSVLLVGTYRDTELAASRSLAKAMEDFLRQRLVHDMVLKRFPEEDVAAILRERTGQEPPASLVRLIFGETGGNPFFVEEIFKHLSEEDKLFDSEGQWRTGLQIGEADVPRSVRLVLGHRIQRLTENCRNVLTAAAIVGRAVSFTLLKRLGNLPEEDLLEALDEAERAELVRSKEKAGDVQFTFPHDLIRQTLLSEISMLRRQRLHFEVAEAIEQIHARNLDERATELAYHLFQAGIAAGVGADLSKTIHYLTLAGDRAFKAAAFEEALGLHVKALDLSELQLTDDRASRARLLYKQGLDLRSLGRMEEALGHWEEALAIYEELDDTTAVGRICTDLSTYRFSIAQFMPAYEFAIRGLAAMEDRIDPDRCKLLAVQGFVLGNIPDKYVEAQDLFAQALEMAADLNDERLVGPIMARKALLHHAHWQGREAAEAGLKGWKQSESHDPYGASYPATYGAQCGMLWTGNLGESERIGEQARALAVLAGNEHARWFAGHYDSFREVAVTGDLPQFEERRKELLEIDLALKSGWETLSYSSLGRAQFWRGQWEDARRNLQKGVETDVPGHTTGIADNLLFLLDAYSGDKGAALAILEKNRGILPHAGRPNMSGSWQMLEAVVEGLAVLGEREQAADLYPLTLEAIATDNIIRAGFCGLVQTTAGIAAAAGRRWEEAEEHCQIALRQAHDIPYTIEQPEIRRWYAHMLIQRDADGDRKRAHELLTEAIEMYAEFGMPKHQEIAEELMVKL